MKRRSVARKNIHKLPKTAGVYFLTDSEGEIFYIGKSGNIRKRVADHMKPRGGMGDFNTETTRVSWVETAGEIEALLEESKYIKKYFPKYNVMKKDDTKYFYVAITTPKGGLPYITLTHQLKKSVRGKLKTEYVGPFTEGRQLKLILRYLRKIFPYYTSARHTRLPCSYCHLDLCPGTNPNPKEYKKDVRRIVRILEGNRRAVEQELKREMKRAARALLFEQAEKSRDTIIALEGTFAHKEFLETKRNNANKELASLLNNEAPIRTIEGYDISNIQGREPVASMVRFENSKPDKSLYRKFRMRLPESPNDVAMMREVVSRRLAHPEWPYPDLFLIDGGKGQLNAAIGALRVFALKEKIPLTELPRIISLAKRENEIFIPGRKTSIHLDTEAPRSVRNLLMFVRDESHRFAVTYHRKLHRKKFR